MRNPDTIRTVRGQFAQLWCSNLVVNSPQPFDNTTKKLVGLGRLELPTNGLGRRSGPSEQPTHSKQVLENTTNPIIPFWPELESFGWSSRTVGGQSASKPIPKGAIGKRVSRRALGRLEDGTGAVRRGEEYGKSSR